MKTIKIHSILQICFGLIIGMALFQSCNKDDGLVNNQSEEQFVPTISLGYPDSLVHTPFRKQGSIAPNALNWNGEKGTLSISSTTEILSSDDIKFEEDTGIIFWSRFLPLGEFDLIIAAKNSKNSVKTKILLNNTFDKGFFSGGFKAGNPMEIDPTTIQSKYGLTLHEDQTVSMSDYNNPTFSVSGRWEILGGANIAIEFISSLSGGKTTYMKGYMLNGVGPKIEGVYGGERDSSGEILNPTGKFLFKWD